MIKDMDKVQETAQRILQGVSRVVIGKEDIKEILLVALLSQGHVLIEGLSGTAKTTTARTFCQVIGGEFKRVQFTPDMLPADITGFYLYSPDGQSRFLPGPLFANIVLADELNRTTPRTQAALVEAMQENQVTVEGKTFSLPQPFMVVASQLPYGFEGTYPLTEVQIDRFMFRLWSDYPSKEEESQVIAQIDFLERPDIKVVIAPGEIQELQEVVKKVYVSEKVREYIISLVQSLRQDPDVLLGASPRASIALFKGARALALLRGRDFVLPDEVKKLALPALEHRVRLKPEAEMDELKPRAVVQRVLDKVPVPKMEEVA